MKFNKHTNYVDKHAFLSPSRYHWLNYDDEKLANSFFNFYAREIGTRKHNFAAEAIELGIKLPRTGATLNRYVNDAIGFKMTPEQPLLYSENCFGTADAIAVDLKKKTLRIHDLKTGQGKASMLQLIIYAAIFFLEYDLDPREFKIILRIYQHDSFEELIPETTDILNAMSKITHSDKRVRLMKAEV